MGDLVVAVDVGTTSARAGVFAADGTCLARAEHPIRLHRPREGEAEHESEDIWRAVCAGVREARRLADVAPERIAGIAFDATCSLVLRDRDGAPVTVSVTGQAACDTIVWLDHRAVAEAAECTATGHRVLDAIGGVMSPEMQVPKLMWLKRHLPHSWARAGLIFDLADFLAWKATGSEARSVCTLVCKWTYLAHEAEGWQRDFLRAVGLDDLLQKGGLPAHASAVADDLGPLSPAAAEALGLTTRCRVGAGMIDAHAGALGVIGALARGASGSTAMWR
ncbi:Glycerol kinase [Methylobrevis pamukkalensis]|uniref:Glycerol kinase n=1 Tax=Methylobrevis pamukkalensis TaxID=1439726 RepID=A0A1E3H4C2_9HYPH|nr:Glycerol kinase [Methylobrevis pamukkalensis]